MHNKNTTFKNVKILQKQFIQRQHFNIVINIKNILLNDSQYLWCTFTIRYVLITKYQIFQSMYENVIEKTKINGFTS